MVSITIVETILYFIWMRSAVLYNNFWWCLHFCQMISLSCIFSYLKGCWRFCMLVVIFVLLFILLEMRNFVITLTGRIDGRSVQSFLPISILAGDGQYDFCFPEVEYCKIRICIAIFGIFMSRFFSRFVYPLCNLTIGFCLNKGLDVVCTICHCSVYSANGFNTNWGLLLVMSLSGVLCRANIAYICDITMGVVVSLRRAVSEYLVL